MKTFTIVAEAAALALFSACQNPAARDAECASLPHPSASTVAVSPPAPSAGAVSFHDDVALRAIPFVNGSVAVDERHWKPLEWLASTLAGSKGEIRSVVV